MQRTLGISIALLTAGRVMLAQCPDGTQPPCGAARAQAAVRKPPTLRAAPSGQPLLTASYDDVPLRTIRMDVSRLTRRTIVASPAADSVKITIFVDDKPWDAALRSILLANGLDGVEDESGIIVIKTMAELRADDELTPVILRTIKLHRPAAALADVVRRRLSPAGWLEVDTLNNALIVNERATLMDGILTLVRHLDPPPKP